MQNKVSIIISAYNAEKYIAQTLQSVLAQSWPHLEIIVVNDGSTDNTRQIVEQYVQGNLLLINQENKGQDAALNEGFRHATGDYIKFMDSDDLINSTMIEKQVTALTGSEELVAYGEWARFYDNEPSGAEFTRLHYWKDMAAVDFLTSEPDGVMLQCGILLVPRKLIEKAGLWDERLILYNDTEFYNRVILASAGVKFTKGARLYYRSGLHTSISSQRSEKYFASTLLAANLIAEQLLAVEDSERVRRLIANTYLNQYYLMFPFYPDLRVKYEEKIRQYREGTAKPQGGRMFRVLQMVMGWKNAKKLQRIFYSFGYKPLKPMR